MVKVNHVQYLDSFKEHLHALAKSQNTIDSYLGDLKQYFNMFDEVNRVNVQKYKEKISNLAATTFNRKLSSLKQFNEYLVNIDVVEDVVVYKQDYISIQQQGNPTNITEKTVLRFLDRVNKKDCVFKIRNFAIIYFMANTGIRREECCNMMIDNLDLENSEITFKGKGIKQRTIALNKRTVEILKDYLIERAKSKYANSPYLFLSGRGNKLRKESINGIFDFYSTPKCKVSPHQLRHNFLSTMLEKGLLSIVEAQNQAGHSSLLTTQRYTHARMDSIKEKIKDFSIG